MMFTVSIRAPAAFAALTTLSPLASSPLGRTGRVSVIFRPGLAADRRASACERRLIEAGSATAAPSMSKSTNFSLYALITAWYSPVRLATSAHAWASSMPLAPPKEIFTSPPAARILLISSSCHPERGSNALNQLALQPAEFTNARVKLFSPLAFEIWLSSGVVRLDGERVRGARRQPVDRGRGTAHADRGRRRPVDEHVVPGDPDVVGRGVPHQAHRAGRGTGGAQVGRRAGPGGVSASAAPARAGAAVDGAVGRDARAAADQEPERDAGAGRDRAVVLPVLRGHVLPARGERGVPEAAEGQPRRQVEGHRPRGEARGRAVGDRVLGLVPAAPVGVLAEGRAHSGGRVCRGHDADHGRDEGGTGHHRQY